MDFNAYRCHQQSLGRSSEKAKSNVKWRKPMYETKL